jgi:hypothetical protein
MRKHKKHSRKQKRGKSRNVRVTPIESADSLSVRLRYPIRGTLATAGTVISKRYTPNGAYDVDPVLGSTSTPGFAEYAALYTYYRVQKFRVHVTVSNLDNLSISLYSVVSNTDPGTAGTNYYDYAQSAMGKTFELAPFYSGRGTATINQTVSVPKLLGMSTAQADSFRSVTTSIPTDLVYWGFGIYSNAGTNFANGVGFTGYIEMHVRFYSRQDQLLSMNRLSGVEWEANRYLYQLERQKQLALLPQVDTEKTKREFEKKVQELVSFKLSKAT